MNRAAAVQNQFGFFKTAATTKTKRGKDPKGLLL